MSQLLEDHKAVSSAPLPTPIENEGTTEGNEGRRDAGLQYVLQLARVATPLCLFDMIAIVCSLVVAYLAVLSFGCSVNHYLAFLGCSLTAYSLSFWVAGVYPGVGLHPARELRQLFRVHGLRG